MRKPKHSYSGLVKLYAAETSAPRKAYYKFYAKKRFFPQYKSKDFPSANHGSFNFRIGSKHAKSKKVSFYVPEDDIDYKIAVQPTRIENKRTKVTRCIGRIVPIGKEITKLEIYLMHPDGRVVFIKKVDISDAEIKAAKKYFVTSNRIL